MASDKDQKSKEKLGHRRIGQDGVISYKKVNSNHLMGSIQLGLGHAVGNLSKHDDRDLLMQVRDHPYTGCPVNWYSLSISIPDFPDGPMKKS